MARFNFRALRTDLETLTGKPVTLNQAQLVRRWINSHHTLQEKNCNGFQTWDGREDVAAREASEKREARIEANLRDFFGPVLKEFGGDPRGGTVKLVPPNDDAKRKLACFERDWGGDLIYTGD